MKTLKIFLVLGFTIVTNSFAQTWEFVGLDSMVIKHLFVSGDTIRAGTAVRSGANINSGLYYTFDGGNNWIQLDSALGSGTIVGMDYLGEGGMFLIKGLSEASVAGNLYKTTNNGLTWEPINISSYGVRWIGASPFNQNKIYAIDRNSFPAGLTNALFKSTNQGNTWEDISAFPSSSHGSAISFAFDLTDSLSLFVTVDTQFDKYLYKSTNEGIDWFYVSEPPIVPREIYTDYFLSNRIYLYPMEYLSKDGGINWIVADSGLTSNSDFLSFYQDIFTTKLLYNLRTDGLFFSERDTIYWEKIVGSENLPLVLGTGGFQTARRNMKNVVIDKITNKLYLGTSSGIFKRHITTMVINEGNIELKTFDLFQNFPNPFNPSTTISYHIPERSFIKISVYNILGKEVRTLVEEEQSAGQYELVFESIDLPSGVYLYVLTAASENGLRIKEGKKMLLIK